MPRRHVSEPSSPTRNRTLKRLNGSNGHAASDGPTDYTRGVSTHPAYSDATIAWMHDTIDQRGGNWSSGERKKTSTKYQPYFCRMVFPLRLMGATNRVLAQTLGVTEQTILNWAGLASDGKFAVPEFAAAYRAGGELADSWVARSIWARAVGYAHPDVHIVNSRDLGIVEVPVIKNYPPDTDAAKFWLTNRQAHIWRNRSTSEIAGPDGKALLPPQLVLTALQAPANGEAAVEVAAEDDGD